MGRPDFALYAKLVPVTKDEVVVVFESFINEAEEQDELLVDFLRRAVLGPTFVHHADFRR